jgi:hypothetical protein
LFFIRFKQLIFKYYEAVYVNKNYTTENLIQMTENSIDELLKWVISVDRRLILMESMKKRTFVRASDIAHEASRSTQNISHALKELESKDLIECLTPDKTTWKISLIPELRLGSTQSFSLASLPELRLGSTQSFSLASLPELRLGSTQSFSLALLAQED